MLTNRTPSQLWQANGNGGVARPASQADINAMNMAARNLVTMRALKKTQNIFSQSAINPAATSVFRIVPRNAGLIVGFIVTLSGTVTNVAAAGGDLTISAYGVSNVLNRILYQDLSNNTRIDTTGRHLSLVNSAKNRAPFLAARTNTGYPIGYGNNFTNIMQATSPIAQNGGTGTFNVTFWVPLAYSPTDLRGAVFANVVNATQQLQLTLQTAVSGFFGDVAVANAAVNAVYTGAAAAVAAATITNVSLNVHQVYWDQLPTDQSGKVVLPVLDLATIYELKETVLTGLTVAQDFPVPYSNFRDFLSTTLIYANGTQLNNGTDINTVALELANFTNIWKVTPNIIKVWERQIIEDDLPAAGYYLDSRDRPISTVQFGNMQLLVNPSVVNAGANIIAGFEDFAYVNAIPGAGSLPAG